MLGDVVVLVNVCVCMYSCSCVLVWEVCGLLSGYVER